MMMAEPPPRTKVRTHTFSTWMAAKCAFVVSVALVGSMERQREREREERVGERERERRKSSTTDMPCAIWQK